MRSLIKLIFWFVLWIPTWVITVRFKKMGQENCMTWAISQWEKEDGYLVVRWCRSSKHEWFKWPHFLWLPADKHHDLQHIVPVDCTGIEQKSVPDPWFDPKHIQGDDPKDYISEN